MGIIKYAAVCFITCCIAACTKSINPGLSHVKVVFTQDLKNVPDIFTLLGKDGSCVIGFTDSASTLTIAKWNDQGVKTSSRQYPFYPSRKFNVCFYLNNKIVISGLSYISDKYFVTLLDSNLDMLWDSSYVIERSAGTETACMATDGNILVGVSFFSPSDNFMTKINVVTGAEMDRGFLTGMKTSQLYFNAMVAKKDGIYFSGSFKSFASNEVKQEKVCYKVAGDRSVKWIIYDSSSTYSQSFNLDEGANSVIAAIGTSTSSVNDILSGNYSYNLFRYRNDNYFGKIVTNIYDPITGEIVNTAKFDIDSSAGMPILMATPDNGFVIAAIGDWPHNTVSLNTSIILIKTDAQLNVQWQKKYYQGGPFRLRNLAVTNGGYSLLASKSYLSVGIAIRDYIVLKTDANGNLK